MNIHSFFMDVHDEYSLICFCDVHDEYSLFFSWCKLEIIVYLRNFEVIYINNHYVNEKRFRKGQTIEHINVR